MTPDAERDAFMRAILEQPADDTVRLVYADWLDEHGEADRADFIRVQIALAPTCTRPRGGRSNIPTHRCVKCGAMWTRWEKDGTWSLACEDCEECCDNVPMGEQVVPLDAPTVEMFCRESNLLARNWREWFSEAVPGGRVSNSGPVPYFVLDVRHFVNIEVTRGFIGRVTLPVEAFEGDGIRCPACAEAGPDWETGVVECSRCDSTGILCEPITADLFGMHPITAVEFEERDPGQFQNTQEWYWTEETETTTYPRRSLPSVLFKMMGKPKMTPGLCHIFKTRREAVEAASTVAVAYGRSLASLPPLYRTRHPNPTAVPT